MPRANVEGQVPLQRSRRAAPPRGGARRGATPAGVLRQVDTFFRVPSGRLKLRDFGDGSGELISYRRADEACARRSDYRIIPTHDPAALAELLAHALGACGVVRKTRTLLLWRSTRIHLDEVEGLGRFVELETVLERLTEVAAAEEHRALASALGLRSEDVVPEAYVDLLARA